MTRIELEGGKYTVVHNDGAGLAALRHGEPWRDLCGDGLVLAMAHEIERLSRELKSALAQDDPYAVSINVGSAMVVDHINRFRNGTSVVTIKRVRREGGNGG